MSETVKRYEADIFTPSGRVRETVVKSADYARLEQECDRLMELLSGVMSEVGPLELGTELCGLIDAALSDKP